MSGLNQESSYIRMCPSQWSERSLRCFLFQQDVPLVLRCCGTEVGGRILSLRQQFTPGRDVYSLPPVAFGYVYTHMWWLLTWVEEVATSI